MSVVDVSSARFTAECGGSTAADADADADADDDDDAAAAAACSELLSKHRHMLHHGAPLVAAVAVSYDTPDDAAAAAAASAASAAAAAAAASSPAHAPQRFYLEVHHTVSAAGCSLRIAALVLDLKRFGRCRTHDDVCSVVQLRRR
jgi:hypothetical protein